jgi:hypothetical protein
MSFCVAVLLVIYLPEAVLPFRFTFILQHPWYLFTDMGNPNLRVLEDQNRKIAHFKPTLAMNTGISVHISATLFDNYTRNDGKGRAISSQLSAISFLVHSRQLAVVSRQVV